jgi:GR25 family glycosyltransferase involved in LPS biosynthesis
MFTRDNTYAAFVNLDHRKDRLLHMQHQLKKSGIADYFDVQRQRGMLPSEYTGNPDRVSVMRNRTPGAIGCHYSQVRIMNAALQAGKHAFVMEDDLVFCDDFLERLGYTSVFLEHHPWDVLWLGATFHINPPYWHTGRNRELRHTNPLGRDAELTDDPRIIRTYGAFSTYAYIVNHSSLKTVLQLLERLVPQSIGIDWAFIKLQPDLFTYAFVPGSVKQMDNKSDIGSGFTYFSNFRKLNGSEANSAYWWQKRMEDFDPKTFNWQEAGL